jgi:hypothetical protein
MADKKTAAKPIDIAALDTSTASDKGAEIELTHPTTQEPIGLFVTVLGKHSQVFRDIIRERVNTRLREEALAERRGKRIKPPTAEEVETKAVELLVACTTGWRSQLRDEKTGKLIEGTESPNWTLGNEELPYSVANAIRVYTGILWIREQVDNAIGDLENFIAA